MLLALDLTPRQAARVLAEAVRRRAKMEIDPRPEFLESPLWGTLESRDQDLLLVYLLDAGHNMTPAKLIGAMCDVRTILSDQLYLFSTVIVDAADATTPQRLTLAVPEGVQVANRRRFSRRSPVEPIPVRLTIGGSPQPHIGTLMNISRTGLGCRAARRDLDALLLIGDEVQIEFVLPWTHQVFALPGEICVKNPCHDPDQMIVGIEFRASGAAGQATLELLRTTLDNETQRLTEMGGDQP